MYAWSRLFLRLGKCVDLRDEFAGALRQPVPVHFTRHSALGAETPVLVILLSPGFALWSGYGKMAPHCGDDTRIL
jgi:hypothetical protein